MPVENPVLRLSDGQVARLQRVLDESLDVRDGLVEVVHDLTVFGEGRARDYVTQQSYDTGGLARGIVSSSSGLVGRIQSQLAYGIVVEEGRRPGGRPPPPQTLVGWIRRHGLDVSPFVLARAIGRRGIPAKPFMAPALRDATREAGRVLGRFGDSIVIRWARGQ